MKLLLTPRPIPDFAADDHTDEVSSVRRITGLDLELGVAIDAFASDRDRGDPTPVYAKPYAIVDGNRNDCDRSYFLGTRFETGIIASACWEDEMRVDGVSEFILVKCRRYLSDNA